MLLKHNKERIKEELTVEDIKHILHELGASGSIDKSGDKGEIITNTICHNSTGGGLKLYYYTESKTFFCFSECQCSFDVYELVRRSHEAKGIHLHFNSCVDWVASKTGKSYGFGFGVQTEKVSEISEEMNWMSRFNKVKPKLEAPKFHGDGILKVFSPHRGHPLFTDDHITEEVMDHFEVSYYDRAERIAVPHRYWENGKIIGIKGRATREVDLANYKYLPLTIQGELYNFPNYSNLYGFWQNKEAIKRHKKIIIFESEKSVMQCASYFGIDNNFSIALSGRNLSQNQIDIILKSGATKVIIALDKEHKNSDDEIGIRRDTEFLLKMAKRFSNYMRTFVIFDDYDLLDKSDSPSDKGKDVLLSLLASKKEVLDENDFEINEK